MLAARYEVSAADALVDVRELAAQLVQEQMVRAVRGDGGNGVHHRIRRAPPYRKPLLVIYRDMEDLLALDPPLPQYAEAPWKKS